MNQNGFFHIVIILIVLVVIGLVGGAYYLGTERISSSQNQIIKTPQSDSSPTATPSASSNVDSITKEQAIECVKNVATKEYPDKRFKVEVTDENESTWFTSVVEDNDSESLMGWYPVSKSTCETHFAKP